LKNIFSWKTYVTSGKRGVASVWPVSASVWCSLLFATYCSKEHQTLAWNAQQGEQKANGVTQFLAHKFLCCSLQTFKSVAKGGHQSEECRTELLGLLCTMVHWKPPELWGTAGKLAERQLVGLSVRSVLHFQGNAGVLRRRRGERRGGFYCGIPPF
jgi:hypothetical protein